MDYKAYVAAFRDQVDAMRRSGQYYIPTFEMYGPMRDKSIEEMEEYVAEQEGVSAFRVPERIRSLYRATSGFELSWSQAGRHDQYHGPARVVCPAGRGREANPL